MVVSECLLIEGQRLQSRFDGAFLIVIQPNHQAACDGLQVVIDIGPLFQGFGRAIDDVLALMAAQVEHAFAKARGGFRQGQWVAAAQLVTFKAQLTHGVIHIQLDHIKLVTCLTSRFTHLRARRAGIVLLLDKAVELPAIVVDGLLHALQTRLIGAGSGRQLLSKRGADPIQLLVHLRGGLAVLPQSKITLGAARLQHLRIDCRQTTGTGMPVQHGLHCQKATAGNGNCEQQHQAEATHKLFSDRQIGEQTRGRRGHSNNSVFIIERSKAA